MLILPIDLKFAIHRARVYAKPRSSQPPVRTASQYEVEESFQNGVSGGNLQVKKHKLGISEVETPVPNLTPILLECAGAYGSLPCIESAKRFEYRSANKNEKENK